VLQIEQMQIEVLDAGAEAQMVERRTLTQRRRDRSAVDVAGPTREEGFVRLLRDASELLAGLGGNRSAIAPFFPIFLP